MKAPSFDQPVADSELEDALRRAFVRDKADYICITSRRQEFQIKSFAYGVEQGWLKTEVDDSDEQSTVWIGRLTPKGKLHFGLLTEVDPEDVLAACAVAGTGE